MKDPATIIAILAVICALFLAVRYMVKEKKRGAKCIGCPFAGECHKYGHPEGSDHSCA